MAMIAILHGTAAAGIYPPPSQFNTLSGEQQPLLQMPPCVVPLFIPVDCASAYETSAAFSVVAVPDQNEDSPLSKPPDRTLVSAFAEPTTLALVAIGLIGIIIMRWRRNVP
jgi:hypothetical protein